ncbi:VQ motif-containing protein 20 [Glycine max]|nr:VQ motif-containing protein 20 [Glycine max]
MTRAMPTSLYKQPQQHHHPVIIYTHSPKVIHTQPKDFMSLVQKLTGLSRSGEEKEEGGNQSPQQLSNQEFGGDVAAVVGDKESDRKNVNIVKNEDNETSSVITEENNCSSVGENQVNSCFMTGEPSMLEPKLNPYVTNFPVMAPSSAEFVCSSQPFLNYSDSLFFSHNLRTSLEGMKEFLEH